MKEYILLDDQNIIRCVASNECNLHKDKLHMTKLYMDISGYTIGDEYNPETGEFVTHPENYPQPTEREKQEELIREKMRTLAIEQLKEEGKLPQDFQDRRS